MKRPKISIIIPVYNTGSYLEECLESIKKQTFRDFEVICINDGSTDKSLEIMEKFAREDKRFRVVNQKKNMGICTTRAAGYKKASGEYIAWVDADDVIDPEMYDKMYKLASEAANDVVICNYNFFPEDISRKRKWYHSYNGVVDWKFVAENTLVWNKIVKKSLLDKLNIVDLLEKIGEEAYAFVLISANGISTIDEPLYNYRVGHQSSSSNFKDVRWFKQVAIYARDGYSMAKKIGYSKEWQEFFKYVYLKYNLLLMVVASMNGDKMTYEQAGTIVKKGKLFSKKYEKYLKNNYSDIKIFVFKNFVTQNYTISKILSRIALGR